MLIFYYLCSINVTLAILYIREYTINIIEIRTLKTFYKE